MRDPAWFFCAWSLTPTDGNHWSCTKKPCRISHLIIYIYTQNLCKAYYGDCSIYLFIRIWKFNLPVNSSWPKESLVQNVNSICGHENLFQGARKIITKLNQLYKNETMVSSSFTTFAHWIHTQYLDLVWCFKSIKLVEKLQHSTLHLTITIATARFHSSRSNAINFIHEDNWWSMLPVEKMQGTTPIK